jgi:hypothetical protein
MIARDSESSMPDMDPRPSCDDSPLSAITARSGPSSAAEVSKKSLPDNRTKPIWGDARETALYRKSGHLFRPRPGRLERSDGFSLRSHAVVKSCLSSMAKGWMAEVVGKRDRADGTDVR